MIATETGGKKTRESGITFNRKRKTLMSVISHTGFEGCGILDRVTCCHHRESPIHHDLCELFELEVGLSQRGELTSRTNFPAIKGIMEND